MPWLVPKAKRREDCGGAAVDDKTSISGCEWPGPTMILAPSESKIRHLSQLIAYYQERNEDMIHGDRLTRLLQLLIKYYKSTIEK